MTPYVDPQGRTWHPFSAQYDADEKVFQFTLWALSHEHAQLVLQDLKDTARITGQIVEEIND